MEVERRVEKKRNGPLDQLEKRRSMSIGSIRPISEVLHKVQQLCSAAQRYVKEGEPSTFASLSLVESWSVMY